MPVSIATLQSGGVLNVMMEGLLDDEEMNRIVPSILREADSRSGYHILIDARRAHSLMRSGQLYRLVAGLSHHPAVINRKIAVVVPAERLEVVRVIETVPEGPCIRAFDEMDDAWGWFGESTAGSTT